MTVENQPRSCRVADREIHFANFGELQKSISKGVEILAELKAGLRADPSEQLRLQRISRLAWQLSDLLDFEQIWLADIAAEHQQEIENLCRIIEELEDSVKIESREE